MNGPVRLVGKAGPATGHVVHVITTAAVGVGDPAVVVIADDGGDIGPRVVEVHRWLSGPGAPIRPYDGLVINGWRTGTLPDLDELVRAVGWEPLANWRAAAVGYYLAPVEPVASEHVEQGAAALAVRTY